MKRILIIQTGGTIAMQIKDIAGFTEAAPHPTDFLESRIPELSKIAHIEIIDLFFKDSSDVTPDDWKHLAKTIFDNYNSFDGFVILHGTDTMAYTASALSFCLNNLGKPVILTGSQIPMAVIRSDASRNLINAIEMATMPLNEVAICFNDHIFRGNRSTKISVGDFDAFSSPNYPPLADIGLNISLNYQITPHAAKFRVNPFFDDRVFLIRLFPGLNPDYLFRIPSEGLRAIVVEAFGCGNFPVTGRHSLLPFFEQCLEQEILLIINSQASQDAADLSKYESGRIAQSMGIISAGDMTTEASVTKIMYLLAMHDNQQVVRELYTRSLAGERTVNN
ncbi:MAG: asparaginase [Cyclonatronaceae bacterium]